MRVCCRLFFLILINISTSAFSVSDLQDVENTLIFINNPHFEPHSASGWKTENATREILKYQETMGSTSEIDTFLAIKLDGSDIWGKLKYKTTVDIPTGTPIFLTMEYSLLDINNSLTNEELSEIFSDIRLKVQYSGQELFRQELKTTHQGEVWNKYTRAVPGVIKKQNSCKKKYLQIYIAFKPSHPDISFAVNYIQIASDPRLLGSKGTRRFSTIK